MLETNRDILLSVLFHYPLTLLSGVPSLGVQGLPNTHQNLCWTPRTKGKRAEEGWERIAENKKT